MATLQFTATVEENGTLSLPTEVREELGLQPGDEVEVRLFAVPHHGKSKYSGDGQSGSTNGVKGKEQQLRGMGTFKGKLGGTEALFQAKQDEIRREERRF
jgi:AbrB family looped-hinge helix DNA binding protein